MIANHSKKNNVDLHKRDAKTLQEAVREKQLSEDRMKNKELKQGVGLMGQNWKLKKLPPQIFAPGHKTEEFIKKIACAQVLALAQSTF